MKARTKVALALTGALMMGSCGRDLAFSKRVTPLFNSAAASTSCGAVPEYKLPSAALPRDGQDVWRVRLGLWEIAAGGHHTFLEFLPYTEGACRPDMQGYQVHGLMMDGHRRDWAQIDFSRPEVYMRNLKSDYALRVAGVTESYNDKYFQQGKVAYIDLYYGSKDDVLKMYMDTMVLARALNTRELSYSMLSHNSNSVFRTMIDALGLPLPDNLEPRMAPALRNQEALFWTPGLARSLLPPDWDRQAVRARYGYGALKGPALEEAMKKLMIMPHQVWDREENARQPCFRPEAR